MKSNREWIKRTMAANDLVAAGPMRIISTELGRENYTFEIAQPVRKAGSGEDEDAAARDEDEKAASADEQDGDEPTFVVDNQAPVVRSEEHTSELQSLMRTSYAVFCLKKTKTTDIM